MYLTMDQVEKAINGRTGLGIKPGLDRVKSFLAAAGNPEQHVNGIHIAGTNGKGSTSAFIKQALIQSDYKVGTFNSPSLNGLSGHIALNDTIISDNDFIKLFIELEPAIQKLDKKGEPATTFEIITVMAFMYFAQYADIAVIEAGMGGKEDATNVFRPLISIITNVALDHTDYLGSNVQAVAVHKAGIIKSGVPVITGEVHKEAKQIIDAEAMSLSAPIFQIGHTFHYRMFDDKQLDGYQWTYGDFTLDVSLRMRGMHQIKNSSLALMALAILKESGYLLSWETALQGISDAQLPGRYETVHQNPTIILDGAHNPAGIEAFLKTVDQDVACEHKTLVFAAFKDKDIETMLNLVKPSFQNVMLTTFNHPRAADKQDYDHFDASNTLSFNPGWESIIDHLLSTKKPNNIYYFAGSIHFIEKVRKYFAKRWYM
ncbi:Dihydrofolate synthase [Lentibacillus sp. JNUCC-1]|uniref:bifunctional folylpolyglutamate synthase/dihydrofolate synthase n=1 Tax=Lentibacillus sp. JNUCC-1 TaxID=2654513 RepID=UPI0012E98637|nr:folylpolyglutamate synthase/dihydrofolate synthase family protein [Lentibacillus sp. JNUCC-1]MUV39427.1 Dihydrofolate synthase [Lentibacillus sp. JNUCC-1]